MRKRAGLRLVWTPVFLFLLISSSCLSAADLKVRTTITIQMSDNSEAGQVTRQEDTVYVQGTRERMEILVPSAAGTQQPHSAVIVDQRSSAEIRG
jgi:hypothetical protein